MGIIINNFIIKKLKMTGGFAFPLGEKCANYESVEMTIAGNTNNYNVKANNTGTFSGATSTLQTVGKSRGLVRIITDQTIIVKYNDADNAGITITSSESPYYEVALNVSNIFITTTVQANVKITLYYI